MKNNNAVSKNSLKTLESLRAYGGATLGAVHKAGNAYRFEHCSWCKRGGFTLKAYVKDGIGRCTCSACHHGGDIFDLARAYLGASVKSFHHLMRHIEDRLNRLRKETPHD